MEGASDHTGGKDFGCGVSPHVMKTGLETGSMLSFLGSPQAPTENLEYAVNIKIKIQEDKSGITWKKCKFLRISLPCF